MMAIEKPFPSQIVFDDPQMITRLMHLRNKLINLRHGTSWKQVIFYLLEEEMKVQPLESKIKSLEAKVLLGITDHTEKTEEFLKLALTRPAAPMMAMAQANAGSLSPPPPPPLRKHYRAPNTKNLRKDYGTEVKSIFNGVPRLPTDIIQQTKPKFAETELIEIDDAFEIPEIELQSSLDPLVEAELMKEKMMLKEA